MTPLELQVLERFLDSKWGTPEFHASLGSIITMVDVRKATIEKKAELAELRKETWR